VNVTVGLSPLGSSVTEFAACVATAVYCPGARAGLAPAVVHFLGGASVAFTVAVALDVPFPLAVLEIVTVISVVPVAVPVNEGVVSVDGVVGCLMITVGATGSAANVTGAVIAWATIVSSTPVARYATPPALQRALNSLVTLPPSMFQSGGEPGSRPQS
jgi:hypothetical protein